MMGANYQMVCPLIGRAFRIWALPGRLIQVPGQRDWRFGARVGRDANGSRTQKVSSLNSLPLAARKASVRDAMEFLKNQFLPYLGLWIAQLVF